MAIKFQYNKTSLNEIGKQLKMRQNALPTLKNKESALRLEVRRAKDYSEKLIEDLEAALNKYDYLAALWNEFEPGLISITDVELVTVKVAGVKTPELKGISFETAIIERYRRRESSVEEALIEMYLAGVSVRRVEDITEALWGSRVSPSTISRSSSYAL